MRGEGVECIRHPSARYPGHGVNVALFTPAAFVEKEPLGPPEAWRCTATGAHDVSFMWEEVSGLRRAELRRSVFLVGRKLPRPAA